MAIEPTSIELIINSWSITQLLELKVDREHYPLIIAVRLNPYQYENKTVQIVSVMRLKPVTTRLRVMFDSHYTIKVVARSCRFFMFRFIFRFGTISYTVYTIKHSEFGL